MEVIDILKLAIVQKRQISYEYELEGKAIGIRFGNPHAIFISKAENINIDIYKNGGVRSCKKPIPDWRQYKVKHIKNVFILEQEFVEAKGYNPNSIQYSRVIAKI
ncbi:hypothetical protein ACLI09_04105 [Flavobacterium sp. RHBU_24]|uniref:hypothetical protein n=1 Tax=Flavobacterium sp. RHBU_24 TaxID=3391185 RepID=UPI003984E4D7